MTTMTPIPRSVDLLNCPAYADPEGRHTYLLVPRGDRLYSFHVPGCDRLDGAQTTELTGTYWDIEGPTVEPCVWCHPHGGHHVTLPDGTRRYRPLGPITTGRNGDRSEEYGEFAIIGQNGDGVWQVHEWSDDLAAALDRAVALGLMTVVGPRGTRYDLPPAGGQPPHLDSADSR